MKWQLVWEEGNAWENPASFFALSIKKNPSWNTMFLSPSLHGEQLANNRLKYFGVNSLFNLRNALLVHKKRGIFYKITLKVSNNFI